MQNENLWAPWRNEYLKSLGDMDNTTKSNRCFFCDYWAHPKNDESNHVLWRTNRCLVVFNRFPYTGGHLLIAPALHVADMDALDEPTILEMMLLTRDAQKALIHTIKPQGFNIGININRCAGAGLPEHIHLHLVPRWDGDTNFIAVTGQVRVISQALDDLYHQLRQASQTLNLPSTSNFNL